MLFIAFLIFPPLISSQSFSDVSVEQAAVDSYVKLQRYLSDYGYLETIRSTLSDGALSQQKLHYHPVTNIRDALKTFQKFAGLKTTGELDTPTKQKMQQKRCGRPDVLPLRREAKWVKNDLTYGIDSYPNELSQHEVRKALKQAFDIWSGVTPLTFNEVTHSSSDINVAFVRRIHGDPWPFDGKGGVLAHATLPPSGKLHFDSDEIWTYLNPQALTSYDTTDMLPVAIHEIGHILGLEHSADSDSIMAAFYKETLDYRGKYIMPKLSSSDIASIQQLYGSNGRKSHSRRTSDRVSDFQTDLFDVSSNPECGKDVRWDGTCPDEVDAVLTREGTNYVFSNSKVYEFGREGITKEHSLRNLFPNGPPFVQGALSNPRTSKTLLFHGKMVYGYYYEKTKGEFVLEKNYPKRLPADLDFKPMGAFLWIDGSQILLNGHHFATYDENWNHVTLQNRVENYFNFPKEPVRGVLFYGTKMLLFGDRKVYKYDKKERVLVSEAIPLRTFFCCA